MNEPSAKLNEKSRSELPIEQQANFEGSWTNLMLERMRDPLIKKQVADIIFRVEESMRGEPIRNIEGVGKIVGTFQDSTPPEGMYTPRTREEIEKELNDDIEQVAISTPVTFDRICESTILFKQPAGREIVSVSDQQFRENRQTDGDRGITEAHEKGHLLRNYEFVGSREKGWYKKRQMKAGLDDLWDKTFDLEAIDWHDSYGRNGKKFQKSEDKWKRVIAGYLRSPMECAERMAQLKNYFGMAGGNAFTKEHLRYAKEHYVKDTGFDNQMTEFFQSITHEKEDAFIELINSAGI